MSEKKDTGDFYKAPPNDSVMAPGGNFQYKEMPGEKVELPVPGWEKGRVPENISIETLPQHIISRLKFAFTSGHLYGGTPDRVLAHFHGTLEGLGLADAATLKHIDKLQAGLAKATDPQKYFEEEIRPFLSSLRAAKR